MKKTTANAGPVPGDYPSDRAIDAMPAPSFPADGFKFDQKAHVSKQAELMQQEDEQVDFMPELFRWLARVRFERPEDEEKAAQFGAQMRAVLSAGPAQAAVTDAARDVPERTSQRIRIIANSGEKELIEDVSAGRVSIKEAAEKVLAGAARDVLADAKDADRWREVLMHVGGAHYMDGVRFSMGRLKIEDDVNIMQGSIAEHFTTAIDAARALRTQSKE